jgi:predicted  nucleic acid-binding Zn-ribbon protein
MAGIRPGDQQRGELLKIYIAAALFMLSMVPLAQAGDLSALQTAVEISRQEMEGAQADYNAAVQRVAVSRKNLEDAREKLAQSQKKADESQKRYQEAKSRYERAQTALDNAWKQ